MKNQRNFTELGIFENSILFGKCVSHSAYESTCYAAITTVMARKKKTVVCRSLVKTVVIEKVSVVMCDCVRRITIAPQSLTKLFWAEGRNVCKLTSNFCISNREKIYFHQQTRASHEMHIILYSV